MLLNMFGLYLLSYIFTSVIWASDNFPNYEKMFDEWIGEFHIRCNDEKHRDHMFRNWLDNHLFIENSNQRENTFELGHNQFSGMNETEYMQWVRGVENDKINVFGVNIVADNISMFATLPASIDWTAKGAVTPVKDQGQCGSCWSFSTTGALEGAYAIKYGKLSSFSEQQLVDCDTLGNGGRDHGCNGGLMDNAFSWIAKNDGLCSEVDYPYVSGTTKTSGTCAKTCRNIDGSDVTTYVDVQPASDLAMMTALTQQPVSVAIEADQHEFQLYKSGVFTGTCGTNLDHGVLAVGYGTDAGVDYYKIKNSWSATWGEKGYIRIGRGVNYNGGKGQCGILLQASYPVV
jgi:C1A family cysteine protease